jgi:hypothetical protein
MDVEGGGREKLMQYWLSKAIVDRIRQSEYQALSLEEVYLGIRERISRIIQV